jgi:putative ABC transport system permease protein
MEAHMLGEFFQDLRFSLKSLFLHPSAAIAAAVAAMALGIGAAVAIFSVVNAVLLQPLPYPGEDRVVAVWNQFTKLGFPRVGLSLPEVHDYQVRGTAFQALAGVSKNQGNLTGGAEPERVTYAAVSPGLFTVLGIHPSQGRVFLPNEGRPGAPRVAVLGDAFWRDRRGADPRVIGRELVLNDNHYTVVGIMPRNFRYLNNVDLWVPLLTPPEGIGDRGNHGLRALARLKPGVSLHQAQVQMSAVARQELKDHPDFYTEDSGWGVILVPLREELTGKARPALLILLAAVSLVLLMACANVANLQLERALARSREAAVRTALGEPRGRLIRRFTTESLVVTFVGGALGVLVAAVAVRALTRIDPTAIPRTNEVAIDLTVLLFAVVLALLSGLAIGLVPAVQTSRLKLTEALKEGGEKSVGGRGPQRVRRLLVVVETAMALVLIVGAGLLVRAFVGLQRVDLGFPADHTLTFQLVVPEKRYPAPEQVSAFYQRLLEGVAALPGVRHVGLSDCIPVGGCEGSLSYFIQTHMPAPGAMPPETEMRYVSPDYFSAMAIPLKKGRSFTTQEGVGSRRVLIVDEDFARINWPGEEALGKAIKFSTNMDTPWWIVVGVVGHVKNSSVGAESREQVYAPLEANPKYGVYLAARTGGNPATLAGPARGVVKNLDAQLPTFDLQTMDERLAKSLAAQRFSMSLLLSLAVLALFLAAVGMYSVITNTVNQRKREIGMRLALGAQRRDILGMVVGEGVVMALLGVGAGLALAYWATKLLASLLFGIGAADAATYLTTALLLLALAAAVSYFPARKATRVSPMRALGRD